MFAVTCFAVLSYVVAKFFIFSTAFNSSNYFRCENVHIYFIYENVYSTTENKVKTVILMIFVLKDPIIEIYKKFTNVYEIVDFKTLVKSGTYAFSQFSRMKRVVLMELESELKTYVDENYPSLTEKKRKELCDLTDRNFDSKILYQTIRRMEGKNKITEIENKEF